MNREIFSPQEKEVYSLLCQNRSNREIAEELGIAQITVSKRLERVYNKLGISRDDPRDYHSARRQAIMLGQDKNHGIPSSFLPKSESELFSEWDIRRVSRELTWYDRDIVNAIMTDLILFLKEDKK